MTSAWKWSANSCIPTTPCCSVEWSTLMTCAMPAAHVPLGWRATILHVRIRRYRCSGCGQVWRLDTTAAAAPKAKLSTQAVMWALKSVVIDHVDTLVVAPGRAPVQSLHTATLGANEVAPLLLHSADEVDLVVHRQAEEHREYEDREEGVDRPGVGQPEDRATPSPR